MEILLQILLLVVGFVLLIKGADFFVDGSGSIARKLQIPDIIVGLTIVAMGTSAPELAVSVSAALGGSTEIAMGNVVGSNILNILIILGVSALIVPLAVDKSMFKRDFPVLLLTAVLLPAMALLFGNEVGLIAGIIFLVIFAFYIFLAVRAAIAYRKSGAGDGESKIKILPWWQSILYTVGGAAVIVLGGNLSVEAAKKIAAACGISEAIIGLTVVALGTSLPELVTSVIAAKKGSSDIALGNIVGSNIFNILFILGTTAVIKPVPVPQNGFVDMLFLLGITVLLFIICVATKKINRVAGASFLALYVAYATYLFLSMPPQPVA